MIGAKKSEAPDGRAQGVEKSTANSDVGGNPKRAQFHLTGGVQHVGAGLTVRFSYRNGQLDVEWAPRPPTKRELSRVVERYRGHRHAFVVELGRRLGGTVACVEA